MKKLFLFLSVFVLFLSSCKSSKQIAKAHHTTDGVELSKLDASDTIPKDAEVLESEVSVPSHYEGVSRIKHYDFAHPDVPKSFDGFQIAFISDLHYKSLFKQQGLFDLVSLLKELNPDALFMGGDYYEDCENIPELFKELSKVKPKYGTYAVLGNNDYERCYDESTSTMAKYKIRILEHQVDTIRKGKEFILVAGIRNPFDLKNNGISPTLSLHPNDFVVLLTHTPDYAEEVSIRNSDLVLAGHTHGGQVRILGYAPIIPSKYGQRFLTGLKYTTAGYPMIVTNGIGTSQIDVRVSSPSEIVVITLKRL